MRTFYLGIIMLPLIEILLFLFASSLIGISWTLSIIIATSILGVVMLRKQGMKALRNVQIQWSQGNIPGEEILNSLCIFIGGGLLLFPGFLTDILGMIILFPPSRQIFKGVMVKVLRRKLQSKNRVTIIR